MKRRVIAALGAAVAVAALTALVTAFDAAVAQESQERVVVSPQARAFQLLGGGGSFLGVTIREVNDERASEAGMSEEYGVYIESVSEEGPAADAGVREGDVIVSWNGARVEGVQQLQRLLRETPAGRTVRLGVVRDGSERTLSVELAERSRSRVFTGPGAQRFELRPGVRGRLLERPRANVQSLVFSRRPRLGASIQSMGEQLADYFGVDGGALVTSVSEGSPAEAAGLRAGDVIVELAGEAIEEPGDLLERLADLEPGRVEMRVVRDGSERTLTVEIEERAAGPGEGDGPFGFHMEGFEMGPMELEGMEFEGMELEPFEWHFERGEGEGIDVRLPSIRIPSFELPAFRIPHIEMPALEGRFSRIRVDV